MSSLQGRFLVAAPQLGDSNFFRSVVFLLKHDEDGAVGLVINRPLSKTVSEVWEKISDEPCRCCQSVHCGGPVPGPLIALHDMADFSESEIANGVHLCTQRATLERMFESGGRFRLFTGYSGWSPGQLEDELLQGGWLLTDASPEQLFCDDTESLWRAVTSRIGEGVLKGSLRQKHLPEDPLWN